MAESAGGTQVKTLEELYGLLVQVEHTKVKSEKLWVYEKKKMVNWSVTYHPSIYQIFERILLVATDNPTMDTLLVNIDRKKNLINICAKGGDEVRVDVDECFHDQIFKYFGELKIVMAYRGKRYKQILEKKLISIYQT